MTTLSLRRYYLPAKYQGALFILIASFCFSTTGTAQALAPAGASPLVIGALRLWVGCVTMLGWCLATHKMPDWKRLPPAATLFSALGILAYQLGFFAAAKMTGVALSAVVVCGFIPVATGGLSVILLREKLSRIWCLATAVAVCGLGLLSFAPGLRAKPAGLLLALLAAVGYGFYAVMGKKVVAAHDPETVIMVLFAIGALLIAPVFFFYPVRWVLHPRGLLIALHLGVIATALAYTTYMMGLKTIPAATCATINLSEALMAACWGVLLLGERPAALHYAGMALIFSAVVLLTWKQE